MTQKEIHEHIVVCSNFLDVLEKLDIKEAGTDQAGDYIIDNPDIDRMICRVYKLELEDDNGAF